MSQAGVYSGGGGGGGSDVQTLTGNSGGAVGPDGASNIIVGDQGITVVGDPGTNTLTISSSHAFRATVQTTDDTPTTIISTTLDTSSAVTIDALIVGLRDDDASGVGGRVTGVARRAAGGAILVGTAQVNFASEDAGGMQVTVSGNDILVQVIGEAAQTYDWSVFLQLITTPL
jgi:hypothetical protein